MRVLVATAAGTYAIDPDEGIVEPAEPFEPAPAPSTNLPRVVHTAAAGSTVVALVDSKPPLLVSHDAGSTWHDAGRGLPAGHAVAVAEDDPDLIVYAARNRLYVSRNGGVFWHALDAELPEIRAVAISLTAG